MKQYRITSQNFVHQGETGDADAVMDSQDLADLKRLAGVPSGMSLSEDMSAGGLVGGNLNNVPQAQETGIVSPVGTNITHTAKHRNDLLRQYNARPGDELWFLINFDEVRGPPANNGTLEQKIQQYLKTCSQDLRRRHDPTFNENDY
jgi:hypothetical protein